MGQIEEILQLSKNKKIVLFGEIHGTKEIPEFLERFFLEASKMDNINICFEIPSDYQDKINDFFETEDKNDGRNCKEYFKLVNSIKELINKQGLDIKIICVDVPLKEFLSQNEREKQIASNILSSADNKKTFAILGKVHASKKPILFKKEEIYTVGTIISNEIGEGLFNINIIANEGNFYNFGIKTVEEDNRFKNCFNYNLNIGRVSPCEFVY
jgi:hypothetical protein